MTPDAPHFHTCALRPSGIFGVGDHVVVPSILDAYFKGQARVQIGSNKNHVDFTVNTNVAHAHYLAAAALVQHHRDNGPPTGFERADGEVYFITNDDPRYF